LAFLKQVSEKRENRSAVFKHTNRVLSFGLGIPETIFQALRGMSPEAQSLHLQRVSLIPLLPVFGNSLYHVQIVLTGGNVRFPGFVQRLYVFLFLL
jgi:hypothetical protein